METKLSWSSSVSRKLTRKVFMSVLRSPELHSFYELPLTSDISPALNLQKDKRIKVIILAPSPANSLSFRVVGSCKRLLKIKYLCLKFVAINFIKSKLDPISDPITVCIKFIIYATQDFNSCSNVWYSSSSLPPKAKFFPVKILSTSSSNFYLVIKLKKFSNYG